MVPVTDCIAAIGPFVVVSCDGLGDGGKRVWGLRMIGGVEERTNVVSSCLYIKRRERESRKGRVRLRCDGRQEARIL